MFTLPKLSYDYKDLEPHIDARTMEIHHSKHHQGYVDKLNGALESYPDLKDKPLEYLLKNLDGVSEEIRVAVRNNGGGHFNHSLFWRIMSSDGGGEPSGDLGVAIEKEFSGFEKFKDEFSNVAKVVFGSGWVWLVKNGADKLIIKSTANQDNPITEGLTPIIGIDIWEHAYYLKYQNRRTEYIDAWWNVVNWSEVARFYSSVL